MNNKKVIVIVCGYSSGSFLAQKFNSAGYSCVHVTLARLINMQQVVKDFNENDYLKNIIIESEENIKSCLEMLSEFDVIGVVAGSESGVLLADEIAKNYNVPKNDDALSLARRNKYYMIEELRNNGLLAQQQIKSSDLNEIINWYLQFGFKRIVLKPLLSAGSDNVHYCNSLDEIKEAFNKILNSKTIYNEINDAVLAQEYIHGDEYIINTFSFEGQHKVIDIWRGVPYSPDMVSNDLYADLVNESEPEHGQLSQYICEVLQRLGIQHGAAHCEVRINDKGQAYLIECGARLAGKIFPSALEKIYPENQLSLLIQSYANPEYVRQYIKSVHHAANYARYVYFKSDVEGLIINELELEGFYQIPSLFYVFFSLKKGGYLNKTCKIKQIRRPGFAYLISNDYKQIEKDYIDLVELEKKTYSYLVDKDSL